MDYGKFEEYRDMSEKDKIALIAKSLKDLKKNDSSGQGAGEKPAKDHPKRGSGRPVRSTRYKGSYSDSKNSRRNSDSQSDTLITGDNQGMEAVSLAEGYLSADSDSEVDEVPGVFVLVGEVSTASTVQKNARREW